MSPSEPGTPRIAPLAQHPAAEAASGGRQPALNIFLTLAKHERLLDRFTRFGGFLLARGLLPAREREIVILRVGWRCGSQYEFGQHTLIGRQSGLSDAEIARLASDGLSGWSEADGALIRLADELCAHDRVADQTWAALRGAWSEPQLIELLVLAGFYRLVSGFLNSAGVQPEPGVPGWPAGAH